MWMNDEMNDDYDDDWYKQFTVIVMVWRYNLGAQLLHLYPFHLAGPMQCNTVSPLCTIIYKVLYGLMYSQYVTSENACPLEETLHM